MKRIQLSNAFHFRPKNLLTNDLISVIQSLPVKTIRFRTSRLCKFKDEILNRTNWNEISVLHYLLDGNAIVKYSTRSISHLILLLQ